MLGKLRPNNPYTVQKMEFSIKDFFCKCDQILVYRGIGHIHWINS